MSEDLYDEPEVGEFHDPAYWASLLADYDDAELDELPLDSAAMNAGQVSAMMRALRALYRRLGDYDQLHQAELDRLEARRAKLVGPLAGRIVELETTLRQYMQRAFLDFGKTTLATPNGTLRTSRPLLNPLAVRDADVAVWLRQVVPAAVSDRPVVSVTALRKVLTAGEGSGLYRRAISTGDLLITDIDDDEPWAKAFQPGWKGVWQVMDGEPPTILPGVTWSPAGLDGCGRDFTITIA